MAITEQKKRLKVECEWCGSDMAHVKSTRELLDKTVIACGWCPKCGGTVWSKPANWEEISDNNSID